MQRDARASGLSTTAELLVLLISKIIKSQKDASYAKTDRLIYAKSRKKPTNRNCA